MKIIVALDSFKGTLRALPACRIVRDALLAVRPDLHITCLPMADGGEGTAEVMLHNRRGRWISQPVTGPLPDRHVTAGYARFDDDTALVEMASASGLERLTREQMNPLKTTTVGTGELIARAIEHGARTIYLAVGGSATVDGGIGAAAALGWQFLDAGGKPIGHGGGALGRLHKIVRPDHPPAAAVRVLCDVTNPLCGPNGAARVYGPQKGASPADVEILEQNLCRLAACVKDQLGINIKDLPGAGAAGGLAAGAVAFLNASIVSGIETVMRQSRLVEQCRDADWIITGEGSFDRQSLCGKVVSGILRTAEQTGAKVAVLAGRVALPEDERRRHGIQLAAACQKAGMPLDYALAHADALLTEAAKEMANNLK